MVKKKERIKNPVLNHGSIGEKNKNKAEKINNPEKSRTLSRIMVPIMEETFKGYSLDRE